MDLQLNSLEYQKLELVRNAIDAKIRELKQSQILHAEHERKYNVLIYGFEEKRDENITSVSYDFMLNDLEID